MAHFKRRSRTGAAFMQRSLALMMVILSWVMRLAPIGIFALLTKLIAVQSLPLLMSLVHFITLIFITTFIHGALVLPGLVWVFGKSSPLEFFKTEHARLCHGIFNQLQRRHHPRHLKMRRTIIHPPALARFVIPLGATINMDGNRPVRSRGGYFYRSIGGYGFKLKQPINYYGHCDDRRHGCTGIPGAGMVTMILVLQAAGLPVEAIAILLPIDRLLDTIRTAVNAGDLAVSVVVRRFLQKWRWPGKHLGASQELFLRELM